MAQSVKRLTSAQVMVSQFVSSSRTSGSMPTAQSLEPASDSVSSSLSLFLSCLYSVSLSLCLSVSLSLSLSHTNKYTLKKNFIEVPQFKSPVSGSVLTAQSLEPTSESVSPSPPVHALSLSLSEK